MNRIFVLIAIGLAVPVRVQPQSVQPAIVGVREGRGYASVFGGTTITASSTDDGLVEITVDRDTTRFDFRVREPSVYRGFYRPAAVMQWVAAVDTLRNAVSGAAPLTSSSVVVEMQGGDRSRLQASGSEHNGRRYFGLAVYGCRGPGVRIGFADLPQLPALMTSLSRAAEDASRAPNAIASQVYDGRVYHEHAVGCAATPLASNPRPEYPIPQPNEPGKHEVLARFVVDTTGVIVPGSVRIAASENPRFAEAARQTLARWRFTTPTRRGVAVRQLSHAALVFEPPVGDSAEPGCAMTGRTGVLVRPMSASGAKNLEGAYLTHVATNFALWFERPGVVGSAARLVVRRNGTVADQKIDRAPADSALRWDFEQKMQGVPFTLDPLPPTYPTEAVALEINFVEDCRSPRTGLFFANATTFTPLADGMIEVGTLPPNLAIRESREPMITRDVVRPDALRRFLDTTSTLFPMDNGRFPPALDRWSGSLAEVPILGYRGNVGLVLGLGTQGQLHGGINCANASDWISVRREDLGGFWRIGREALVLASSRPPATGSSPRVYLESEVACAALPMVGNAPIPYVSSHTGSSRTSEELLFELTVDTLGAVVPRSVMVFPGTDPTSARAVRQTVGSWRFRPAMRGGRRVRQRLHMAVVVRPPEADASVLATKPVVQPDSANRTIFFKKP
jgi:hypothetical protein